MKDYILIGLVSFILPYVLLMPASDGVIWASYIATLVTCYCFLLIIRSLVLEMHQLKNDKVVKFQKKGDE